MAGEPIVETTTGRVRGVARGGVAAFKGVPYAAPPLGDLRFRPPVPHTPWGGVRDAFDYGHRAMQDESVFLLSPGMRELVDLGGSSPMNEDCLVLNVWTPSVGNGGRRPVMVWLHGGAFVVGSGGVAWNDGGNLARDNDVVVVSINHRLGAFGFLHLEDRGGADFAGSGGAGMLDIVAALRWVRDNIARFGGDSGNVTVFGESGGGAKICVLLAMPAARGLFHKAIIQSGPAVRMASRSDGDETARLMLEALDLDAGHMSVLRAMPAERLLRAQVKVMQHVTRTSTFVDRRRKGFNPVVDGTHLPDGPFDPAAPRISADVPLMIGTNKDEMTLLMDHAPWMPGLTEANLVEAVRVYLGDRADAMLAAYRRIAPDRSPRDTVCAIVGDQSIRMPSLLIADRKLAQRAAPVFVYLFAWETPVLGGRLKSPHTLEIPFVFDTVADAALCGDAPTRQALARRMSRAWAAFARAGDPNHAGLPSWPAYDTDRRLTMVFDDTCRIDDDPFGAERRAWND